MGLSSQLNAPPIYPRERIPISMHRRLGLPQIRSGWFGVEKNFVPSGIRTLDHPAVAYLLYRLCYPGSPSSCGRAVSNLLKTGHAVSEARQRTKRRDSCFALCSCSGWHINYFTLCSHIKYCTLSNLTHFLMFGVQLIHCHAKKKSLHVTDYSTE
jgi:hypothetical protein